MLAGLIFATEEAEDRPDTLSATLPFGGMTLLEYQVRLLIGAGAGHILVAVGRVTPALLGAVSRAGKRGVPVDVVRSAEEAVTRIHPMARVLVMADGLVTTDTVIHRLAADGPEALLVTKDVHSAAALERVDQQHCWAGLARIPAKRLADVARMPRDYDFQSLLLRLAAQAGAEQLQLPEAWERGGHAIERSATALASRGTVVLAALTERRPNWADRWVFTRIARLILPRLVERGVRGLTLSAGGGALALVSLATIWFGFTGAGLVVALGAAALFASGGAMAALRGDARRAELTEGATGVLMAAAALLAGWKLCVPPDYAPLVIAIALVAATAIAERVPLPPRRWWASPAAQLILLAVAALAGLPLAGLGLAALYAFATLAAGVELTREKP